MPEFLEKETHSSLKCLENRPIIKKKSLQIQARAVARARVMTRASRLGIRQGLGLGIGLDLGLARARVRTRDMFESLPTAQTYIPPQISPHPNGLVFRVKNALELTALHYALCKFAEHAVAPHTPMYMYKVQQFNEYC